MRIIFMGTPEFAVPCLEMLVQEGYKVVAVVTQPDKPKGRGNKLTSPPVKEFALKHCIEVLQPVKVRTKEYIEQLRRLSPDLFVTAAYGRILIPEVLEIPPFGCINVHGSLLPKYRGAAPIQWSVINGEKVTGITTMFTDAGMDTGDMLLKEEIEINDDDTAGTIHDKLSILGAKVLKDTLDKLKDGTLVRTAQNSEEATSVPMIDKQLGLINWSKSSTEIHNLVRGTDPWPGAFTFYQGQRMRVWKTRNLIDSKAEKQPGGILSVNSEGIVVACGKGALQILELQFDSGKRLSVEDYLRGHTIDGSESLG